MIVDELLELAKRLSPLHHGMASIRLLYHPYKGQWEAQASWSDGTTITVANDSGDDALFVLRDELLQAVANTTKGAT